MAGMTGQQRALLIEKIRLEMPNCDRGKQIVIERVAKEILDDLQLAHLADVIEEVKREWK